MTVAEIKEIQIPAKGDAVVWLWTTQKYLRDAFSILEDWGFEYKNTLVWDKVKMGVGHWLRFQTEFCLMGVKGRPIIQSHSERDIITEPRRQHSRKPDAFYEMVTRFNVGAKVDLFAREPRDGFHVLGIEKNKFE